MQARVTAVLVARRGGEPLRQTLSALAEQSRRPDRFVVVDAAGDAATTAALMELAPTHAVTAPEASVAGMSQCSHPWVCEIIETELPVPPTGKPWRPLTCSL